MHNINATELEDCNECIEIYTAHTGTYLEAFITAHNSHFYGSN